MSDLTWPTIRVADFMNNRKTARKGVEGGWVSDISARVWSHLHIYIVREQQECDDVIQAIQGDRFYSIYIRHHLVGKEAASLSVIFGKLDLMAHLVCFSSPCLFREPSLVTMTTVSGQRSAVGLI